jgi:ribose 5-phosphate isomerase A
VERIVQQGLEVNKDRIFVPSGRQLSHHRRYRGFNDFIGFQSKQLIVEAGLILGDVDQHPNIDITLDGADEQVAFSPYLNPSDFIFLQGGSST